MTRLRKRRKVMIRKKERKKMKRGEIKDGLD